MRVAKQRGQLILRRLWMVAMAGLMSSAAGSEVQEIVVTALKQKQKLQDTPSTVDVVTAQDAIDRGVTDIRGIANLAPSIQLSAENTATQVFIRGIGQSSDGDSNSPAVAVNFDGIYTPRYALGISMFDIAQVEVLRHDGIIQEAVGTIEATVRSAVALSESAAKVLETAFELWGADVPFNQVDTAFVEADLAAASAQVIVSQQVIDVAGRIFNCLGASSTLIPLGLDRHWRNARTVATHNSVLFKARVIGDYVLNDTLPTIFRPGHDVGEKAV